MGAQRLTGVKKPRGSPLKRDSLLLTVLSRKGCQGLGTLRTPETCPCTVQTFPVTVCVRCLTPLRKITGRNCFVGRRRIIFGRGMRENQHYCREIFLLFQLSFILLGFMHSCFVYPPIAQVRSAFTALLLQRSIGSFITQLLNSDR